MLEKNREFRSYLTDIYGNNIGLYGYDNKEARVPPRTLYLTKQLGLHIYL